MARISNRQSYPQDAELTGQDFLIGTDRDGALDPTRTYSLESIREFVLDGLGFSLPDGVPLGFAATVNRQGSDIERSMYRVLATGSIPSLVINDASQANVILEGVQPPSIDPVPSSSVYVIIRDRNDGAFGLDFQLDSLVGTTFQGTIGNTTYTGRITEFLLPDFLENNTDTLNTSTYTRDDNGAIFTDWRFRAELTGGGTFLNNEQTFNTVTFTSNDRMTQLITIESQIIGPITIKGNALLEADLNVNGNTDLDGTLNVDGAATFRSTVDVEGDATFEQNVTFDLPPGTEFTLGDPDASHHTFTRDADGLRLTASPQANNDFTVNTQTEFNQDATFVADTPTGIPPNLTLNGGIYRLIDGLPETDQLFPSNSLGIQRFDSDLQPQPPITYVIGNGATGTDQGLLTSIQIGNNNWHLPAATSSVGQILPGLVEELSGSDANRFTGEFFYGDDEGLFVTFESTVATQPAEIAIMQGSTVALIGTTGQDIPANLRTLNNNLLTAFQGTPTGQRLFFVTATTTGQSAQAMTPALTTRVQLTAPQAFGTDVRITGTGEDADDNTIVLETTSPGQTVYALPATLPTGFTLPITAVATQPPGSTSFTPLATTGYTILAPSAIAPATQGQIVDGTVFEVVEYDAVDFSSDPATPNQVASPGQLTFSRVGIGNIQIGSQTLTITSDVVLPNLREAAPTAQHLLYRDPITGELSTAPLSGTVGGKAQVRYCPDNDPTNLTNLSEIRFQNASASNGVITVGSGNFAAQTVGGEAGGAHTTTTNWTPGSGDTATVEVGGYVVLGTLPANPTGQVVNGILRLPQATPGDGVRVVNVSTRMGANFQASGTWGIGAAATGTTTYQSIYGVANQGAQTGTAADTVILDDTTAAFDMLYISDSVGWIIIE